MAPPPPWLGMLQAIQELDLLDGPEPADDDKMLCQAIVSKMEELGLAIVPKWTVDWDKYHTMLGTEWA